MTEVINPVKAGILEALAEAVKVAGSEVALASGINVSSSMPAMWKQRKSVPARYCPDIERFTASKGKPVICERLAPDVAWDVLRMQIAPKRPRAKSIQHAGG
jgi:DNA-binding transcriptional regulator YdaS (Cro superfamily)